MSHLEILYQSLFTVIAEYYNIRTKQDISTRKLMSKPLNELIPALDKMINEMLGSDKTREQILFYFRDLIALSHAYLSSSNVLTETECCHLHGALTDFIVNINQLRTISHNTTIKVTIDTTQRELYGLLSGVFIAKLSRLGNLIQSKILAPLSVEKESTWDSISTIMSRMISEHESAKRAVENKLHTEITTLKLQNQTLSAQVAELTLQLNQEREKYTKILAQKDRTITLFESDITQLKEELIEAKRSSTSRFIASRITPSSRPTPTSPSWLTLFSQGEHASDISLPERLQGKDLP